MNGQDSVVGMVIKLEAIKFCVRVPAEKRDFSVDSGVRRVSLFNRQKGVGLPGVNWADE
jgi:hypothetical protein